MSSLVLDLQQEVLKPDCDVLNSLRKAHLIAAKLKLSEFDKWVQAELNGYVPNSSAIPDYRKVHGSLKAFNPYRGWVPTQLNDNELEQMICEQKLWQSLGELQELYNQSAETSFLIEFPAEQMQLIASLFRAPIPLKYSLHVSKHLLVTIVEKVKNCLLEWTIRLEEEGIIGEGMRFSQEETDMAKRVPQTINNYYGTVVNGSVKQSQVVSGNNHTISFHYGDVTDLMGKVKESLAQEQLSADDRDSAAELISEIESKISQQKKPGIICAALTGLRDFLVAGGANVTAALIVQYLQGLG